MSTWTENLDDEYGDDRSLTSRQSIYSYATESPDLIGVFGRLDLEADMAVADVGCGNGLWLNLLADGNPECSFVGLDLFPGMVASIDPRPRRGGLTVGDAMTLPMPSERLDRVLALWMLYHVPDAAGAVAELARVLRPDGLCLTITNRRAHLSELHAFVDRAVTSLDPSAHIEWSALIAGFDGDNGAEVLGTAFDEVESVELDGRLKVPDVDAAVNYLDSLEHGLVPAHRLPPWADVIDLTRELIGEAIAANGPIGVTTASIAYLSRRKV